MYVCMYVCMYICICICICICIYVYVYIYIFICIYTCIYIYANMYMYMYVYIYKHTVYMRTNMGQSRTVDQSNFPPYQRAHHSPPPNCSDPAAAGILESCWGCCSLGVRQNASTAISISTILGKTLHQSFI